MDYPGFRTDLPNGLTVSVQWHDGAYANRNNDGKVYLVEIACWKTKTDTWMTRNVWPSDAGFDDIIGYVAASEVVRFIDDAWEWRDENA